MIGSLLERDQQIAAETAVDDVTVEGHVGMSRSDKWDTAGWGDLAGPAVERSFVQYMIEGSIAHDIAVESIDQAKAVE